MRTVFALATFALLATACSHPLEIYGEGDVLSASGDRDCLLENHASGHDDCTENLVAQAYVETYYAVPRSGWHFHRWANYCANSPANACSFDIPATAVTQFWGEAAPPLQAIFRPNTNTGFRALFIGHSFFNPFAQAMPAHAARAGFVDHDQSTFFSGGGSGAPLALWNNSAQRNAIQAVIDGGDIDLMGMTFHTDYPTIEGYRNWVSYALQRNPDTRFFIGMPWEPFPQSSDPASYEARWHGFHPFFAHGFIDTLRAEFPGVDFYCIPYGQAAVELRKLFADGALPEVADLVGGEGDAIYTDSLGHPGDILEDLGELVWLRAIYGVHLHSYPATPGYQTDLRSIGQAIVDAHDPLYNAP